MKNFLIKRRAIATASISAALVIAGLFGVRAATLPGSNPLATIKTASRSEDSARRGYSAVVKKVLPAVVNISSSRIVKNDMSGMQSQGLDPFFRQFFGDNAPGFNVPREQREKSLGSGVIVSPEGYILTNNHVIDHATDITVTLHDKRVFKAKVIGTDPRTDIAVLKIEGSNFPTLLLGNSAQAEVGDIVLAVGDPFGVGQTVTAGIVSATGRSGLGIEDVEDFIQTDAPINPGNSGGALVDDEGHLIGINTAILSGNSGGNQGIGFAVPINLARHDMDQIIANGKVERGYLGILPENVTPELAKAFNTSNTSGALVGDVTPNSPASKGGLQKGDIITGVNGQSISDANQLRLIIGEMNPNATAHLSVLRNGQTQQIAVTLGEFPSTEARASNNASDHENAALQGVQVETLTPDTAQQLKLSAQTKGVVVDQVSPDSKAADAGLQRGDVIEQVNHKPVGNANDFRQAVSSTTKDAPVLLLVNRDGNTLFIAV